MSRNKQRGTRWESAVRDYLNERLGDLGVEVYRPAQEGFKDSGDLHGVPFFAIQCKDWRETMNAIREGLIGVQTQKTHADKPWGVNIVKRARKPVGQAYVVMTLEDFTEVLAAMLTDVSR